MKKIMTLILLAFLIGCQPDKPQLVEKEITYSADGTEMKGYLVYDNSFEEKRPAVLVVHEWWGHNDYARERARKLAELGYVAFAVDMYGDGKQANHPDDAGKFAGEVFKNIDAAKARFEKALETVKLNEKTDPSKIAAIGYCFGGGVVLHMARMGVDLDGVVSFHGSISTQSPAEKGKVKAAVLVCNGADDGFVTPDNIESLKKEMADAGVDFKFVNYEGAKHSFTSQAADNLGKKFNLPLAYNKAADEQSWEEMKTFFNRIFAD